eukprot:1487945-Prymnesium_polylepis.1
MDADTFSFSEEQFHFGHKNYQVKIADLCEELAPMAPEEPFPRLASLLEMNKDGPVKVVDLFLMREDEMTLYMKATGFTNIAKCISLLKVACDQSFLPSLLVQEGAGADDRAAAQAARRDNAQKSTRVARTIVWCEIVRERLLKVLVAATADITPCAAGATVGYECRTELGRRIFVAGHLLLEDGSQRNNLDWDVRDFTAEFLDTFYPYEDDTGVEGYKTYLQSRWRNARTGVYKVPGWMLEPAMLDCFKLQECFVGGHLKELKERIKTQAGCYTTSQLFSPADFKTK